MRCSRSRRLVCLHRGDDWMLRKRQDEYSCMIVAAFVAIIKFKCAANDQ